MPKLTFHSGINSKNEATMPIPQTLKMILRFFFSGVISPTVLVNKNRELNANKPKKMKAHMLWIQPLILPLIWKVPTEPHAVQGNKQIPKPKMPANVHMISSIFSYPS